MGHQLFSCKELLKLAIPATIKEVRRCKACLNCLNRGHGAQECYHGSCRSCGRKHNMLLHLSCQGENAETAHQSGGSELSRLGASRS